ncbi:CAP domain-containing protein [Loktanella sp. Alg231-35]|uniref:CAP domain-containing protein n=1 Tax=Loktanella sp. Alg231-35 TaxID=1922220 RepID=UPI001F1A9CBB|nr:CAP domain-containing protein [Loktanella sp. Alg231-35]
MKYLVSVLALAALPACIGGGGGGDVDLTPSTPSASMNTEMGMTLNGARTGGLDPLVYDGRVGQIAQNHANDMFERDYLSIYEMGSTGFGGPRGGERDMGDDLNAAGLGWEQIEQFVAEGDKTVAVLFDEFSNRPIGGPIEGSIDQGMDDVLELAEFEFFGIGKAGSGSDQKFALLLVHPMSFWSDR